VLNIVVQKQNLFTKLFTQKYAKNEILKILLHIKRTTPTYPKTAIPGIKFCIAFRVADVEFVQRLVDSCHLSWPMTDQSVYPIIHTLFF